MNHKLAFILPRVAAATLLVGLAAVALFVVFKLLLAVVAIAFLVLAVKTLAGFFRQGRYGYGETQYPVRAGITPLRESDTIVPVTVKAKPTIVPIG